MKKKLIYIFSIILITGSSLQAQDQIIDILKGGTHDANLIANEYLRPYGEMLGVNLNSGWYNSAKVHKIGGFDLTLTASYTKAPDSKKSFQVPSNLKSLESMDGSTAPTMAGSKDQQTRFALQEFPNTEIATLKGAGANTFVSPMLQAAVGLPYHTEVMGRFMPRVEYGDFGKAYMWGLGLKHSLKDYIPFVKRLPFLQLSVLGAYTHFESSLGVDGGDIGAGNLETSANAYTGRLLIGANLPVVSFYTGMGYGNTKSNFDVVGDFDVPNEPEASANPISLAYTTGAFDFNVGMRLRLAIFSLHADYSVGEYSVITGGIGINFR
ncbi:DUF6588 family protein [Carboxylicivirga sp. N1Y90]|uniref:DUF6588 family protein n=1 Tax=Carboxylicivirga fragile TaxID=3417571 RepID=UPI003D3303EF|nr:hypothetical protein [Marinilabiliaceae bacterium N1Y90]